MRVEVYRNLHKNCYSVRALEGPDKGRVIQHKRRVPLFNPRFVVQPAGRAKVLRDKRKNVHAFVRGDLGTNVDLWDLVTVKPELERVSYNPYKAGDFVDTQGYPVYTGDMALLTDDGVYYK